MFHGDIGIFLPLEGWRAAGVAVTGIVAWLGWRRLSVATRD